MKKLVSVILIAVFLFSVTVVPAFAYENLIPGDYLYEEKFLECIEGYMNFEDECYGYEELYYHHIDENDPQSDIDWVYVNGFSNVELPWLAKRVVADRVFYKNSGSVPFDFGYAIFDVSKDTFVDITDDTIDDFNGLAEMLEELKIGTPIGDADLDDELSILDATYIQLVAAKFFEYDPDDDISYYHNLGERELNYISDADLDGKRTIMDATSIQLKLAGLVPEEPYDEDMVYSDFNNMYGVDTGIEDVDFETLYNGDQNCSGNKIQSERFAVIIKSQEQFESVFYSDFGVEEYLSDEFFNDHWIVASACRVTDAEMVAQITYVGVRGDTLFIRADKKLYDSDGISEPLAPMYHSFVAVDKYALADVTQIIWL